MSRFGMEYISGLFVFMFGTWEHPLPCSTGGFSGFDGITENNEQEITPCGKSMDFFVVFY